MLEAMKDIYTPGIAPTFFDWIKAWNYLQFLMPRAARMRGNFTGTLSAWEWLDALLSWHISLEQRRAVVKKPSHDPERKTITASSNNVYEQHVEIYMELFRDRVQKNNSQLGRPYSVLPYDCYPPELVSPLCLSVLDAKQGFDVILNVDDSTLPPFFWCVVPESVASGSVSDPAATSRISRIHFNNFYSHVPR